jgi:hypothetical protein
MKNIFFLIVATYVADTIVFSYCLALPENFVNRYPVLKIKKIFHCVTIVAFMDPTADPPRQLIRIQPDPESHKVDFADEIYVGTLKACLGSRRISQPGGSGCGRSQVVDLH